MNVPSNFLQQRIPERHVFVCDHGTDAVLQGRCVGQHTVPDELRVFVPIQHERLFVRGSFEHQRLGLVVNCQGRAGGLKRMWQVRSGRQRQQAQHTCDQHADVSMNGCSAHTDLAFNFSVWKEWDQPACAARLGRPATLRVPPERRSTPAVFVGRPAAPRQ